MIEKQIFPRSIYIFSPLKFVIDGFVVGSFSPGEFDRTTRNDAGRAQLQTKQC